MIKALTNLILIIVVFVAGMFVAQYANVFSFFEKKEVNREESVILLKRINKVAKLVTVEGYFSELYSHEQWSNQFGIDLNFGPFKKNALLRVNAKVLVGFDLEKMTFETFPEDNLLLISQLPEPEVLSVEPEIKYEALYEGLWNAYSKDERTRLNKMATEFIYSKALESEELKESAIEQGYEILKLIEVIARDAGWEVRYKDDPMIPDMIRDSLKLQPKD